MVVARELITKLTIKVDKAKLREANQAILTIKKALKALGIVAGAELGRRLARSFLGMIENVTTATVRIDALSRKLGVTTGFIQALQLTSQKMGVSITRSVRAIERFNQRIDETRRGSRKSARAFGLLGVQLSDVNGTLKSNQQLFFETAAAIAGQSNHARRAALSMEVFGESGAELIPLLLVMGQEFKETQEIIKLYGAELTETQILQDTKFQKSLVDTQIIFQGLKRTIADAVVPEFQIVIKRIKEFFLVNRDVIRQGIDSFFGFLGRVLQETGRFVVDLSEGFIFLSGVIKNANPIFFVLAAALLAMLAVGPLSGLFLNIGRALSFILLKAAPFIASLLIIDDVLGGLSGKDSVTLDFIGLLSQLDEKLKGTTRNAGLLVKALQLLVGLKQVLVGSAAAVAGRLFGAAEFLTVDPRSKEAARISRETDRFVDAAVEETTEGYKKIGAAFGFDVEGKPAASRREILDLFSNFGARGPQSEAPLSAFGRASLGIPQQMSAPEARSLSGSQVINNVRIDTRVGQVTTTVEELTKSIEESIERSFKNSGVSLTLQGAQ